jgi:hypothetical protein
LGAQDPNSYDVTYYESQLDADTPNAPIGNTTNYTALSNPQIIYIRIQNTASPECYETVSFKSNLSLLLLGSQIIFLHVMRGQVVLQNLI